MTRDFLYSTMTFLSDAPLAQLDRALDELFVMRVGEWGGHVLVDCDDPLAVHKFCSTYPAFEFQARPVIAVEDAVRVELEAIAWRDGLKRK